MSRRSAARSLEKRLATYSTVAAATMAATAHGAIQYFPNVNIDFEDTDPSFNTFASVGLNPDGAGDINLRFIHNYFVSQGVEPVGYDTSTTGGGSTFVQTGYSSFSNRGFRLGFAAGDPFDDDVARIDDSPTQRLIKKVPFGEKINDQDFYNIGGLIGYFIAGGDFGIVSYNKSRQVYSTTGGFMSTVYSNPGTTSARGVWQGMTGYVGFKFRDENTGNTHFGWALLEVEPGVIDGTDDENLSAVLLEFAYNDTPDGMISAGEVPEPHSLGLLAMGAMGVAARRRRKSV